MKKLSALIFFFAIFLFIAKGTFAQNTNFSTTYKVNYQVSADESTKVILEIELKNKTSNYFASSYEILTGFENIRSINAQDTKGPLSYEVSKENGSSLIKFDFNENAVGLGNSQKFRIEFVTDGIADHLGNIWEVNIPGVSDQASYDVFEAIVTVPQEFGEPSFIKPATNAKVSGNTLRFTKSDLSIFLNSSLATASCSLLSLARNLSMRFILSLYPIYGLKDFVCGHTAFLYFSKIYDRFPGAFVTPLIHRHNPENRSGALQNKE